MHYEEQSRSAREMDWKADKLVFVFNSARPNLLLVQIGAALFNSARAVLNFHHLRVGNCESMYSRRKWWKETSVAPKEKGEQIDFKSDSGWKKWLKAFRAGGGGGLWWRISLLWVISGNTDFGFTVSEPSSFFIHQHLLTRSSQARSVFYHDFIGLLSIHTLAQTAAIRGCE